MESERQPNLEDKYQVAVEEGEAHTSLLKLTPECALAYFLGERFRSWTVPDKTMWVYFRLV